MRFKLILQRKTGNLLPINYQYPLSAAIYKILARGDEGYAEFLHEKGYGKGYKFFTFSDLRLKFKLVEQDRMRLLDDNVELYVHFHMPEASRTFIEGLFKSEEIAVADKKSKVVFAVQSIISEQNPWKDIASINDVVRATFRPISALLVGIKNANGNYDYLAPTDVRYLESLLYNWRGKIRDAYDDETAKRAILHGEVELYENPYRSRLVHIKQGTGQETKVRGFMNFKLKLTAERRFMELIYNAGIGLGNAQGMGCCEVVEQDALTEKIKIA